MKGIFTLALFLFMAVISCSSFNEPKDFEGVPWNSSEETLKRLSTMTCDNTADPLLGDRICYANITIGTIPVEASFYLRDDRFVRLSLWFNPTYFYAMVRIFEEKYGKPTSSEESKAAAQKGRPFTNELVAWTGPVLEIQLMKYSGRSTETDSSVAHFRLHSESAKFKEIIDKSLKKRAKVL